MTDVTAGIGIQIDSAGALAQLRQLQAGISQFNQSVISSNAAAVAKQKNLISTFAAQVEATKQFSTSITTVETSVGRLGKTIDTGKLKLGEYFKYGVAAASSSGKLFAKQHAEIMSLATDRVKRLQTQYVALGESANGMQKALAIRPLNLFNSQAAVATQRMQIFNKLMTDGTTSLINWGKNTQWAGRQLMVGFTVPLTIFGAMAAKTFTDIEKAMVSFKRVYGDTMTTDAETNKALDNVKSLANEYTKYGVAVSDTIGLAAKAAATGAEGDDLVAQTREATRLATLGQIDYQKALDTTISLQAAFGVSSKDLGSNIDFLNAVENQTVLSIDDLTEAIPRVAPVVRGLGGDVKDLAYMLTAMREGGVSAAEGANALKSGLASLINPTKGAIEKAKELNIDLAGLAETHPGDLAGMVKEFSDAIKGLDGLSRQQLLNKVFGKNQYAKMAAMFAGISKEGSQASRVLELMGRSTQSLAQLSENELSKVENAVNVKWTGALERLKASIAPIGEMFLKLATPIVEWVTKIADWFNNLNPAIQTFVTYLGAGVGVILPTITMLVGLLANMTGMIIKFVSSPMKFFMNMFKKGGDAAEYQATAMLDTMAAAASLEGRVTSLTAHLDVQASAVARLTAAYRGMTAAAAAALRANPAGFRTSKVAGYASGRVPVVPGSGSGNKDTEIAMLAPGEAVINAKSTKKFLPALAAINSGKIPGYAGGKVRPPSSLNIGDTTISYLPYGGEDNVPKMQKLVNAILAEGSQYATLLIETFKGLEGKIVSVNKIAGQIGDSGIQSLMKVSSGFISKKGQGAPNEFLKAKKAGLAANPEIDKYFQDMSASVYKDLSIFAKQQNVNLPEGIAGKSYGSHISHLQGSYNSSGDKLWMGNNVALDSAFINPFIDDSKKAMQRMVNVINKGSSATETLTDAEINARQTLEMYIQDAKELGLSSDDAKKALTYLSQGLHSSTPKMIKAVEALATTGLKQAKASGYSASTTGIGLKGSNAWEMYGAQRAAQYHLANGGAEMIQGSKAFFKEAPATKTLAGSNKHAAMAAAEIESATTGLSTALRKAARNAVGVIKGTISEISFASGQSVVGVGSANATLGIRSPAAELVKLGDGTFAGAKMAIEGIKSGKLKITDACVDFGGGISSSGLRTADQIAKTGVKVSAAIKKAGIQVNESALIAAKSPSAPETTTPVTKSKGGIGGKLSKGLFATDALFMAGSFLPGQLGEFSQKLMFASMGLQALGGVANALKGIPAIASAFTPLLRVGPLAAGALGAIVSPAGLAIAALTGVAGVAWVVYNAYEENQKKIHALGEASNFTADQLSNLANTFGYTQRTSGYDVRTEDQTPEGRDVAAQAKKEVASNDQLKEQVETAKGATPEQARLLFDKLFANLVADGAPAKVADSIIEQIAQAAGKRDVYVNVKAKITDFVNKDGSVNTGKLAKSFAEDINSAWKSSAQVKGVQEYTDALKERDEATRKLTIAQSKLNGVVERNKGKNLYNDPEYAKTAKEVNDLGRQKLAIEQKLGRITRDNAGVEEAYTRAQEGSTEAIRSFADLVSSDFTNGVMTFDEYSAAFDKLSKALSAGPNAGKNLEALRSQLEGIFKASADEQISSRAHELAQNVGNINDALNILGAYGTGNMQVIGTVEGQLSLIASAIARGNTDIAVQVDNYQQLMGQIIAQNKVASLGDQIKDVKSQIAAASQTSKSGGVAKKKTGGGGGGGGSKPSKYDKKADQIAKANARLDIAEVKIDRTEDAKIQAAMDKRWGGKTIEINGLKVTVKNAADVEYAMEQIDEKIEDINRNEIDPLNDKLDELNDKQDKINRQIDVWQQEIDKINEGYEAQLKPLERQNALLEEQQANLEDQRDKQLEGIDLQVTALQNQIDMAEYAADQQAKLLDDQIEKNELNAELITKQVDAIQVQIDALQEVQKINEILAAQKQSQLNLASALSKGDAGAAAAAMLESQSTAASGAGQLQQAGLEKQQGDLQGQADALTAQNDLLSKRKDAIQKGVDGLNAQLAALQQQRTVIENNYKIELQTIANSIAANTSRIRQLEYERDVRTAYWQDQIDKYAPALRDLENQIYAIEQKIKQIQDQKIKPLERQKDLLDDILGDVQQQIAREKAVIDQKRKQLDYANKINSAMKTLHDRAKSAASAASGIGTALGTSAQKNIDALKKKLKELEAQYKGAKFEAAVRQNLVYKDKGGKLTVFNNAQEVAAAMQHGFDGGLQTENDIKATTKINGKDVGKSARGDFGKISRLIGNALDDKVDKNVIASLYADKDKWKIKIAQSDKNVTLIGAQKARGGILPGFRGVAMGDDVMAMLRSGEGVTVSEALHNNDYESKRLIALNKAALSGNMSSFYKEWSAPEIATKSVVTPVLSQGTGGDVYNDFHIEVNAQGTNVTADELVNKVIYKIKDIQRTQVRSN